MCSEGWSDLKKAAEVTYAIGRQKCRPGTDSSARRSSSPASIKSLITGTKKNLRLQISPCVRHLVFIQNCDAAVS